MSKNNNKGKGGGRRRGNNDEGAELVVKEEGQEYAQVLRMLGNGRVEAQCFDGVTRISHIRGNMRKKVWINNGDIVLVAIRDFQDNKGDIIYKYSPEDARKLKARGELPDNIETNKTYKAGEVDEIPFDFADL